MSRSRRRAAWKDLVDRRLRLQVRIFLVIFLVTVAITIERMITEGVNPLWALVGFVVGIATGAILARTKPLVWDSTERQVVASNSILGLVAIALYLVFVFTKSDIVGAWIDDAHVVGVISIAITSGVMFGRIWITFRGVRGVVRSAGLTTDEH